jgi:hypothetical protein
VDRFSDQKKVVALLDSLQTMDESAHIAIDPTLMMLMSICVLHQGFRLAA